ncbi:hypothetical protein [Agrobacterium tumefaciens]|uniref:hypothetical protein n=1 Tax=Agrobacterium tumefaciens TaxID=358 RepID=UPI003013A29F
MQIAEHHRKLLKWSGFGMGGAVAVHEDRAILASRQTGPQGRERCQEKTHVTHVSGTYAER